MDLLATARFEGRTEIVLAELEVHDVVARVQRPRHAAPLVLGLLSIVAAPFSAAEDREALARAATGDVNALRALYKRCSSRTMAVALRVLKDRTEAEDVVQETFLEVWKRAGEYDPRRGGAMTWIVTIARNRAIDRLRSRDSSSKAAAAANSPAELAPAAAPLELAEDRQNRERVARALTELPPEQRSVIELAYFEGLTQREIAERTATPLGTVKTRVHLAMEKLAALLAPQGVLP